MTTTLDSPYQLGEPQQAGGIMITPLFPLRDPVCEYISLDEALANGLEISEVNEAGDVGELRVRNPLGCGVLLYDGEELAGAKQNRILNVSVLLGPGSETRIPVSCVERGRWSWRARNFASAGHVASPELRRRKAVSLHGSALARGAAQSAVWATVDSQLAARGVPSPTAANSDGIAAHRSKINDLSANFALEPGQCGVIAAVAGRGWCLDAVSRPEVFTRMWRKLVAGYVYDAVGVTGPVPSPESAMEAFFSCAIDRGPSVALGEDLRVTGKGVLGSGLAVDGELVQLSAYGDPAWA